MTYGSHFEGQFWKNSCSCTAFPAGSNHRSSSKIAEETRPIELFLEIEKSHP